MSGFISNLVTERVMTEDYCWILQEPLIYENNKYRITVYDGFDFDFASIPYLFRGIIPKNGMKYDRASCLHDALYSSKILSKKECDNLFLEAMLIDGVNSVLASLMYEAVNIAGSSAYEDQEDLSKYRNLIKVEFIND
ncbi:MAG: DUF1353 domain-containing protein [Ignisphaera sp.]|nr:DUF1353 domain-containing protein [Ignisphaera sp.]